MTPYEEIVDNQNQLRAKLYEKAKQNFYDAWNSFNPKLWTPLDSSVCIHREGESGEACIVVRYSCREATEWEIGNQQYKSIWKFHLSEEHDSPFVKLLGSIAYGSIRRKGGNGFYYLSWGKFRTNHPQIVLVDSHPPQYSGKGGDLVSFEEILYRAIDVLSIRYALKKTMDFHTTDWNTITCLKNRPRNNRLIPWAGGLCEPD